MISLRNKGKPVPQKIKRPYYYSKDLNVIPPNSSIEIRAPPLSAQPNLFEDILINKYPRP